MIFGKDMPWTKQRTRQKSATSASIATTRVPWRSELGLSARRVATRDGKAATPRCTTPHLAHVVERGNAAAQFLDSQHPPQGLPRSLVMSIQLNHTIVSAHDKDLSANFLADVLGLEKPEPFGPFMTVRADNDVTLDYMESVGTIQPAHYAFLLSEAEFDEVFERIRGRGLTYWADPHHHQPGKINTRDGGRGLYFEDPDGHNLEILTRPYGSGE
jgi:catechol 2,3-dioxygenase-like lactoylglutathione lyase family enzyme